MPAMSALTLGYCLVDYRRSLRNLNRLMMDDAECEKWRECARWLEDANVLRRDPSNPQPTLITFASTLKDGVLLCQLMNVLVPNAIDQREIPKQAPCSQFQWSKITCLFLGACQQVLHLKEDQLFAAYELYDLANFRKVLDTLSLISHTDVALRKGLEPFPKRMSSSSHSQVVSTSDEDIYRNLMEDVENVENEALIYDMGPYQNMTEDSNKIYDHIVARQDSKREQKTDAWSTFQPQSKRDHCIKELLDTEQNYVEKALNMIMNKFHAPLQNAIQNPKDHSIIFMNIVDLFNLHHKFYNDLRRAVFRTLNLNQSNDGRPTSLGMFIGDVFLLHKDQFIAYGPYCMALDDSRGKIMELEKTDPVVRAKIVECTSAVNDNQFKLQDLLCLPMQRVLKYHILLSEMIKSTPVDSSDRSSLQQAKEAMEDINAYVNEMKRDHETRQLIMEVQRSITDLSMVDNTSLLDYGRLIHDCEVRVSETGESQSGKMKQRHVFLFDKVLIICQAKRNNTYNFKGAYIMHELSPTLDAPHDSNKFGTITKKLGAAGQHLLYLMHQPQNPEGGPSDAVRYLTLSFKARAQLDKWFQHFQLARDNVHPECAATSGHKARYTTYKTSGPPYKCNVCEKFLKGSFYQGYNCEICGYNMHKQCLGLRPCVRKRQSGVSSNLSFCNGQDAVTRRKQFATLSKGEQVIAMYRLMPSDASYLRFDKDELIEVVQLVGEGLFMGCIVNNRERRGLVKSTDVRRLRSNSMVSLANSSDSASNLGNLSGNRIDRKESTVLPRRPPLSAAPTPAPQPDYMNTEVSSQIWYMEMERGEAERKLKITPNGTFLVRYSGNKQRYAISISYDGDVKHTVIEQNNENGMFYLDEGYVFNTIVELVNYYCSHSLCESFNSLNTSLKSPYRECKMYRALHDFAQDEAKFLTLCKGDVLTLVDTMGEDRGWWKGSLRNKVGFFPISYVEPFVPDEEA